MADHDHDQDQPQPQDVKAAWAAADAQTREAREKADAEARDEAAAKELEDEERKRQEEQNAPQGDHVHDHHEDKDAKKHDEKQHDREGEAGLPQLKVQQVQKGQRVKMGQDKPNQAAEPKRQGPPAQAPSAQQFPDDSFDQLASDRQDLQREQEEWQANWDGKKDQHGRLNPDDVVQYQKEAMARGRANYIKQQEFVSREMELKAAVREAGTMATRTSYEGRDHRNSHMGIDPDDGRSHQDVLSPLPRVGGILPPRHDQSHSNIDAVDAETGNVLQTPNSLPHKIETSPPPAARPLFQQEAPLVRVQAAPVHADITRKTLGTPGEVLEAGHPASPTQVNEPMSAMGRPADPRVTHGRPASITATEIRTQTPEIVKQSQPAKKPGEDKKDQE